MEKKYESNLAMSIVSLALGVNSIIFALTLSACALYSVGIIEIFVMGAALTGMILGICAMKKNPDRKAMGLAGVITSAVGIVIALIITVISVGFWGCICGVALSEADNDDLYYDEFYYDEYYDDSYYEDIYDKIY